VPNPFASWRKSHRQAEEAHGFLSRGFTTLKIESFKLLVERGVADKEAARLVNVVYDPEWSRLKNDVLFLVGDDAQRTAIWQASALVCIETLGLSDMATTDVSPSKPA